MDLVELFRPMASFLEKFFSVEVTLGGFTFTVGMFWIWCILAGLLIMFVKGLSR